MINIAELEQYFPSTNKSIKEGKYTFEITLSQDQEEELFTINLRIKQEDTKEGHLIKFRMGISKDQKAESKAHKTHQPHFEISIYKREGTAISADIYFTFTEIKDKELLEYAKGTVVIMAKIIDSFLRNNFINLNIARKLIYEKEVLEELGKFESVLIEALYNCYKNSDFTVREKGKEPLIIKTEHNLKKYLNQADLQPLFLPLLDKINEKRTKA